MKQASRPKLPALITRPQGVWARMCPAVEFLGGTGRALVGVMLTSYRRTA